MDVAMHGATLLVLRKMKAISSTSCAAPLEMLEELHGHHSRAVRIMLRQLLGM